MAPVSIAQPPTPPKEFRIQATVPKNGMKHDTLLLQSMASKYRLHPFVTNLLKEFPTSDARCRLHYQARKQQQLSSLLTQIADLLQKAADISQELGRLG